MPMPIVPGFVSPKRPPARFGAFIRRVSNFGTPTIRVPLRCSPPAILSENAFRNAVRILRRTFFIQTEDTPNPHSLKFLPGREVLPGDLRQTIASPLAKELLRIEGVKGVMLASDFISVNKDPEIPWPVLKPQIFAAIMDFFATNQPVVDFEKEKELQAKEGNPSDESEVVQMIKEILETRIRPAVQDDGGDVQFMGFKDGVVFVKMQGSCSSCPSSQLTLKSGIERMLMHWIPEVTNVMPVSDDDLERLNLEVFKKVDEAVSKQEIAA